MPTQRLTAVVDTSALIALAHLRLLRLLPSLFGDVYIPTAVEHEWHRGTLQPVEDIAESEGLKRGWLKVQEATRTTSAGKLAAGELEVIALATEIGRTS